MEEGLKFCTLIHVVSLDLIVSKVVNCILHTSTNSTNTYCIYIFAKLDLFGNLQLFFAIEALGVFF